MNTEMCGLRICRAIGGQVARLLRGLARAGALFCLWGWHCSGGVTVEDLNSEGMTSSRINAMSSNHQAGAVWIGSKMHAAMWSGKATSFVDMNPGQADSSVVYAMTDSVYAGCAKMPVIRNQQQVFEPHAIVWSSPYSLTDLTPACFGAPFGPVGSLVDAAAYATTDLAQGGNFNGFPTVWDDVFGLTTALSSENEYYWSCIYGMHGSDKVGFKVTPDWIHRQAVLWHYGVEGEVMLHPAAASDSTALGVYGGLVVGWAKVNGIQRAALWKGTAGTYTDLTPTNATGGIAKAVMKGFQVGQVTIEGASRAALWQGTSASFVDLHSGTGGTSCANALWVGDDKVHVGGEMNGHAALWTVTGLLPESTSGPAVSIAATSDGLKMSWPNTAAAGVTLQVCTNLSSGWSVVASAVTVSGGSNYVTVPISGGAAFYRLSR